MSSENEAPNLAPTPAANAKPGAAPVIRVRNFAAEDPRERLLKRQIPAWVISGGIHVVLIVALVVFVKNVNISSANPVSVIDAPVEEALPPEPNLTNPDLGLDADLPAAVEVEREEELNVTAPVIQEEPVGTTLDAPEMPMDVPPPPGAAASSEATGVAVISDGAAQIGAGGGMEGIMSAGFRGRSGATRDALLKAGGGNEKSQAAVARGLAWLAKVQKSDGRWVIDGSHKDDYVAATGIALLPFLAAGQTHKPGKDQKYVTTVKKALAYLTTVQNKANGRFASAGMYSQGIATIAICEAYGLTLDPQLKVAAQAAVNFVVAAQGDNGSWGYGPNANGDTSIVGWQVQALKSGKLANLKVPDEAFKKAGMFLESVSGQSGATYGYTTKSDAGGNLTAVGLLCRQYMGWGPNNPSLARGVQVLQSLPPKRAWNMYYYYYATQVLHFYGGKDWDDGKGGGWNPPMRDWLVDTQVQAKGPNEGSWDPQNDVIGTAGGRLMTTALCLLTLEVYYRHLPLYKRDAGGLNELDR
jgi:hypothetical protein